MIDTVCYCSEILSLFFISDSDTVSNLVEYSKEYTTSDAPTVSSRVDTCIFFF